MRSALLILTSAGLVAKVLAQTPPPPGPPPNPGSMLPTLPPSCQAPCSPALAIIQQCRVPGTNINNDDDGTSDDDGVPGSIDEWNDLSNNTYVSCLCNANNAGNDVPACQACLRSAPGVVDDVYWNNLVSQCNFASSILSSIATPTATSPTPLDPAGSATTPAPPVLSSISSTFIYTTTYSTDGDDDDNNNGSTIVSAITTTGIIGINAEGTPVTPTAAATVETGTIGVGTITSTPTSPNVATQTTNAGARAQLPSWAAGAFAAVAAFVM